MYIQHQISHIIYFIISRDVIPRLEELHFMYNGASCILFMELCPQIYPFAYNTKTGVIYHFFNWNSTEYLQFQIDYAKDLCVPDYIKEQLTVSLQMEQFMLNEYENGLLSVMDAFYREYIVGYDRPIQAYVSLDYFLRRMNKDKHNIYILLDYMDNLYFGIGEQTIQVPHDNNINHLSQFYPLYTIKPNDIS